MQPLRFFQLFDFQQLPVQYFYQPRFYVIQKRHYQCIEFQVFLKSKLFWQNRQFSCLKLYVIRKRQCQFLEKFQQFQKGYQFWKF